MSAADKKAAAKKTAEEARTKKLADQQKKDHDDGITSLVDNKQKRAETKRAKKIAEHRVALLDAKARELISEGLWNIGVGKLGKLNVDLLEVMVGRLWSEKSKEQKFEIVETLSTRSFEDRQKALVDKVMIYKQKRNADANKEIKDLGVANAA